MAGYVPHYMKKRERLARLEHDLMQSVRSGDSRERQLELAHEVRLGKIRALRAERARFAPSAKRQNDRIAEINEQITELEPITTQKILADYLRRSTHVST